MAHTNSIEDDKIYKIKEDGTIVRDESNEQKMNSSIPESQQSLSKQRNPLALIIFILMLLTSIALLLMALLSEIEEISNEDLVIGMIPIIIVSFIGFILSIVAISLKNRRKTFAIISLAMSLLLFMASSSLFYYNTGEYTRQGSKIVSAPSHFEYNYEEIPVE